MSQVIDNIVNMNNYIYQNNSVRMMLFIISGVFLGYTLEPIPKTLEKLFKNSNIFKFIILFVTACIYVYPLNIQHLINIVVCSILALVIFEGIRIYDKYVEEKEKEMDTAAISAASAGADKDIMPSNTSKDIEALNKINYVIKQLNNKWLSFSWFNWNLTILYKVSELLSQLFFNILVCSLRVFDISTCKLICIRTLSASELIHYSSSLFWCSKHLKYSFKYLMIHCTHLSICV